MSQENNDLRTQELLAQEGLESIGQKLFNTINIELSGNPQSARRWIWELLQNAKDVISVNGKIEINLTENSVEFAHNGAPFSHNHLLAILSQRSTKSPNYTDDEKQNFYDRLFSKVGINEEEALRFLNTSGRFGTGFMTTYLLSKRVSLSGIYSTNGILKSFNISLDREATKDTEMKEKVKDSFSSFTKLEQNYPIENVITNYTEGLNCDTRFTYEFDKKGKSVADLGIADLHNSIPFVLSFVEKLKTIKINEYGRQTTYTHKRIKEIGNIVIEQIEKESPNGSEIFQIIKLSEKYDALTIAIPITHIEGERYSVLLPNEKTPRQFISFPLVGSEKYPFPVIINSPLFTPDDLRSHIYLDIVENAPDFNKKVNLHRTLFEKAVNLHLQLLQFASINKWENIHFLAKSDLPQNITDSWYKNSIQKKLRENILEAEIVVTENGGRIKPKDAKFPIYKEYKLKEFWELCKLLCGDKIPRKKDVEIWKNIIDSNIDDWFGIDFDLTLEKLLLLIQNSVSFSNFTSQYFENDSLSFASLNQIIQFVETEDKELLNRKENPLKVFPNQTTNSVFVEKQKLSRDGGIPKELKDILKTCGEDWYDKLIRDEITVFEKESKLTIKVVSDKIRDKIEKYFSTSTYQNNRLTEEEKSQLDNGMFELAAYATDSNKTEIESLHKFLKMLFSNVSGSVRIIPEIIDFDWKPYQNWAAKTILKKIESFKTLDNFSLTLQLLHYPDIKQIYSEEEENVMHKVDTTLNEIINFFFSFDKNLLPSYAIIPNQLNQLCKYNDLYNDGSIPKELKKIILDFGKDCRGDLLHGGISITLPKEPRDLKWICGELDDIAIKEQESQDLKQPIRELDKWISKQKGIITGLDELFKSFYRRRSGIVLNTYDINERDQFDEILNSGMSADLAEIVKTGTTAATIKEVTNVLNENPDLNSQKVKEIAHFLKEHPEITSDKMEQLIELSRGWDPQMKYTPDEEQKRINFENGWKGEAFVYKELSRKAFELKWLNKCDIDNGNVIVDFEGESHFISDNFDKYDIVATNTNGKTFYIQVKSTTTDISDADQIAMPISIREWNFVFETNHDETYYLARVFNVTTNPVVYFMKLDKPQELTN